MSTKKERKENDRILRICRLPGGYNAGHQNSRIVCEWIWIQLFPPLHAWHTSWHTRKCAVWATTQRIAAFFSTVSSLSRQILKTILLIRPFSTKKQSTSSFWWPRIEYHNGRRPSLYQSLAELWARVLNDQADLRMKPPTIKLLRNKLQQKQ